MNNSPRKILLTILVCSASLLSSQLALAGGSSYEFNILTKSSLVKSGAVLPNAFLLNLQTYLLDSWGINQIQIDSIKISCHGDNAFQSAQLRIGNYTLTSANFEPSTIAKKWYKAVLTPQNLVMQNNSVYNYGIDFTSKANLKTNQVDFCRAEITEHSQLYNNVKFAELTTGLLDSNNPGESYIVVTPDSSLFAEGAEYRDATAENSSVIPLIYGQVNKLGLNKYQLNSYSYNNWVNENMYNVMIPIGQSAKFDVTGRRTFSTEEMGPYGKFAIQEMHLYATPATNGSIGKITINKP